MKTSVKTFSKKYSYKSFVCVRATELEISDNFEKMAFRCCR